PAKGVGRESGARVRIPPFPLFSYTPLNLVKQNVDLTGFCYISLLSVSFCKTTFRNTKNFVLKLDDWGVWTNGWAGHVNMVVGPFTKN
ncbi:hypothetical protein, partial [Micrococcus luteus]|uniref:hypothetical protein n=1 Tax=Micrococcus luteus TaxID=1270 RepID=UPI00197BD019